VITIDEICSYLYACGDTDAVALAVKLKKNRDSLVLLPRTSTRSMMKAARGHTGSKHIFSAMVDHYLKYGDRTR